MKKFNHKCPFCHREIPKIYTQKTITKHKKHRTRIRVIKEVVGEDWATHVKTCEALKTYLNKTK
jgi:hypothetical protein